MSDTTLKIKQFKNKAGEPVAGLTPEHAVYDSNGTRLDTKIASCVKNNVDSSEITLKSTDGGVSILTNESVYIGRDENRTSGASLAVDNEDNLVSAKANRVELVGRKDDGSTIGLSVSGQGVTIDTQSGSKSVATTDQIPTDYVKNGDNGLAHSVDIIADGHVHIQGLGDDDVYIGQGGVQSISQGDASGMLFDSEGAGFLSAPRIYLKAENSATLNDKPIATTDQVTPKADKTYVDTQLATKATTSEVASLSSQIDGLEEDKADVDGYYGELGCGCADELAPSGSALSMSFVKQKTAAGATAQGKAEMKVVKGKTLKVVQMARELNETNYVTSYATATYASGKVSFTASAKYGWVGNNHGKRIDIVSGHKYLYSTNFPNTNSLVLLQLRRNDETASIVSVASAANVSGIITASESTTCYFRFIDTRTSGWDEIVVSNVQFFDLTAMFGAGNEPASVAAFASAMGYASINDVPYVAYTEGSLVNLTAKSIKTTGRNLWDEEWEQGDILTDGTESAATDRIRTKNYIPVVGGKTYFFVNGGGGSGCRLLCYDSNKNFVAVTWWSNNSAYTPASGVAYMRFRMDTAYGNTYKNNILIAEGSTAVAYESYRTATKTLPILEHFADGMKSAGSIYDEMTKTKAIKRIGKVDLGSLTWSKNTSSLIAPYFAAILPDAAGRGEFGLACGKYQVISRAYAANTDKTIFGDYGSKTYIEIKDADYTDAAAFKAAMSGVILYYELATPTEEDITADLTYTAFDGGTEEILTDTSTAPLTADIVYNLDVVATLKKLLAAAISNGWNI